MIRGYYLARYEDGEWCVSFPSLFGVKNDEGLYLQAIRDTQFSFIAKKGETRTIYLLKSSIGDRGVLDKVRSCPKDNVFWEGETDISLISTFDYHCDPEFTRNFIGFSYTDLGDNQYYVCLPELRLK